MPADSPKVLPKISLLYTTLSDAEKKVADYILAHPEEARYQSLPRMAEVTEVSQTTVIRFCRSIGYSGYADFKVALVEGMVVHELMDATELPPYSDISSDDDMKTLVLKVFRMEVNAIMGTQDILDLVDFQKAVDAVASADRVEVVGVGSSLPVVMDLHYRLLRSGVDARFAVDSHMQSINCSLLSEGDVCIVVSYSGETRDTLESAHVARAAGAVLVVVTNFPKSTMANMADARLITASQRTSWIDEALSGRIVQLTLFDALCVAVTRVKSITAAKRLEAISKAIRIKHAK